MDSKMRLFNCPFDTGVGPNLIREDYLEPEWLKVLQASNRTA